MTVISPSVVTGKRRHKAEAKHASTVCWEAGGHCRPKVSGKRLSRRRVAASAGVSAGERVPAGGGKDPAGGRVGGTAEGTAPRGTTSVGGGAAEGAAAAQDARQTRWRLREAGMATTNKWECDGAAGAEGLERLPHETAAGTAQET